MQPEVNKTHEPDLKSWVDSANDPSTDFPVQNLPLGRFVLKGEADAEMLPCVAIGDQVVDLLVLAQEGLLDDLLDEFSDDDEEEGAEVEYLFEPAIAPPGFHSALRARLSELLRAGGSKDLRDNKRVRTIALRPMRAVELGTPVTSIGNYTDFYASVHHATNVGSMFRPDNPLLPNYKWVPIGYHGRASSIVPSGTPVARPGGQTMADGAPAPVFGPCKMLDYELEVGALVYMGNPQGVSVPISAADEFILGLCLVNDWSARDVQKWEYQPLGPFLAKNFATTVSPWLVMREALEPFRVPLAPRTPGDPQPLDYLSDERDQKFGGFDVTVEALIQTKAMRQANRAPHRLSTGNLRDMYWTFAQMIAHHSSNGCNLEPADLLASGTVSGPGPDSRGCLLELTFDGPGKPRKPVELPGGEKRTFLEDGDEIILRAFCEREGFRRIGFGECRGTVAPMTDPRAMNEQLKQMAGELNRGRT